jgi:mannose-6-phosphate isomerase-like protein (cupin superfamily)
MHSYNNVLEVESLDVPAKLAPTLKENVMSKDTQIGDRIKGFRTKKKMTLEDAARESGIPASVIAGIEDHTVSPPLGDIICLAEAFKVSVGEVFGDSADAPFCIVRNDGRKSVSRFNAAGGNSGGYGYESLGYQKQNRQMEPFLVTLTPVKDPQLVQPNKHVGEEFLFVLEGQVDVNLGGHADTLRRGDSIYYDSNLPHVVSCHGNEPATILAVIYARKELMIF